MIRVHATRHPALMVKLKSFRYGTNILLIEESMSMTPLSPHADAPVTPVINSSIPKPATRVWLGHKSVLCPP